MYTLYIAYTEKVIHRIGGLETFEPPSKTQKEVIHRIGGLENFPNNINP